MTVVEEAVVFDCAGARLSGILHRPSEPGPRAVLIVVGGPQYRVGSHRQFLLLARYLADRGTAVLRFDYRGMGDSEGGPVSFEETEPDIRAAMDLLFTSIPGLTDVVIWGLCDGASAALLYSSADSRVSGLALANPWVRTDETIARAFLRHYYKSHLLNRETWRRLFSGDMDVSGSLSDFVKKTGTRLRGLFSSVVKQAPVNEGGETASIPYPERMRRGLANFDGRVLLILSGNDLTAAEFADEVSASRAWGQLIDAPRVERRDFTEANHTFSKREWRDRVASWTHDWMRSW
jgi:exosortase A-associated hydrolase 1